jgi:hypothetical protein
LPFVLSAAETNCVIAHTNSSEQSNIKGLSIIWSVLSKG